MTVLSPIYKAPFTLPKSFGTARMKKARVQENWFGADRFCRVNYRPIYTTENFCYGSDKKVRVPKKK